MSDPSESGAEKPPLVISIQSQVAWGHVGNSAAAYPMRACGVDVVEVPTTLLSNHPHYPTMRGRLLEPDLVAEILAGLVERGVHERAAVVLSGFMGRAGPRPRRRWRGLCGRPRPRTRASPMPATR